MSRHAAGAERAMNPSESKESGEYLRVRPEISSETRVSSAHPDYNEDSALGDISRIQREMAKTPPLDTADTAGDTQRLKDALAKENGYADKLRDLGVEGVLDGVAGDKNGGGMLASRIASAEMSAVLAELPHDASAEEAREQLVKAITAGHEAVVAHKEGRADLKQMASTADLIKTVDNGDGTFDVPFAHVGDSRIYVHRGDTGELSRETKDDIGVEFMMEKGLISKEQYDQLTAAKTADDVPDSLKNHFKMKNAVVRGIGVRDNFKVSSGVIKGLRKGDKVLLVSDGVYDNLPDDQIASIVAKGGGMKELADAAAKFAASGERGSKPDDVTGTMVEFGSKETAKDAAAESGIQEKHVEGDDEMVSRWQDDIAAFKSDISGMERQLAAKGGTDARLERRIMDLQISTMAREYQVAAHQLSELQEEINGQPQAEADRLKLEEAKNLLMDISEDWHAMEAQRDARIKQEEGHQMAAAMDVLKVDDLEEIEPEEDVEELGDEDVQVMPSASRKTPPPKPKRGLLSGLLGGNKNKE